MPSSPHSSSDSPKPSATPSPEPASLPTADAATSPFTWKTNAWLFVATVVSVFVTSAQSDKGFLSHDSIVTGAQFTVALLSILLAHEFGHYIAARLHKVDASLPYFIPLPILSPFGTMGAVIRMRGVIPTRKALLDIGASGPLAGLCLAIPLYAWGIAHSHVVPMDGSAGGVELGESVLTKILDRFFVGPVPDGMTLFVSPVAEAAWAGMFVTMINLFPVGQLDGGHVAYALLGKRQDKAAVIAHRSMLAFFFVSVASYLLRDVRGGLGFHRIGEHINNSIFWLVWFEVLGIIGIVSTRGKERAEPPETLSIGTRVMATAPLLALAAYGRDHSSPMLWVAWFVGLGVLIAMEVRGGTLRKHELFDHPPAGTAPMGMARVIVAIVTLLFFALLFMPTPISM
jgi:membrane-associated protease RseP (regulator of RpoE activity)